MTLLPGREFEQRLRAIRYSAFRLETLPVYRGSGEEAAIAAFLRGDAHPPSDPEQDAWESMLRGFRATGRRAQRVHVVSHPLSDYLRFELTWMYAPSVAAGEEIGIIDSSPEWPSDVPRRDFWLLDSRELYLGVYEPDGTWLGLEPVADPAAVAEACMARDAALHHARHPEEPHKLNWRSFIAAHPGLQSRLPAPAA